MEKKEIQKSLIKMYQEVVRICEKYNLSVYLTGGAVIGAIRHNGFIPWDDDIDVALPREDYEKFCEIAPSELPQNMKLFYKKRGQEYILLDLDTSIEHNDWSAQGFIGEMPNHVFLDIQAFDGVPDNKIKRMVHLFHVFSWRAIYKLCDSERVYIKSWRSWWEKLIIYVWKFLKLERIFDEEKALAKWDKYMRKYSCKDCGWIADFIGKYPTKDVYPKSWWEPGVDHIFEDITVKLPYEYDKYLTQVYGDYMRIPEDKETHIK